MSTSKRLTNWDLLRALSMFLVVVVHIAPQLGSFRNINASPIASTAAIICDPIFFCLSGYFAFKHLRKVTRITYSIRPCLYCYPSSYMPDYCTHSKLPPAHYRIRTIYDIQATWFKAVGGLSRHSYLSFWQHRYYRKCLMRSMIVPAK